MRRSRIAAIAPVLKTGTLYRVRGFESHLLRQFNKKMKDKKFLLLVLFIIILAATFLSAYNYKNSNNNSQQPAQSGFLKIEDKKITDNTKPFKIDIVYPQIDGLDFFNKSASDAVNKEISDFKINSLANDEAVKKVDPVDYAKYPREYDLNISYDKGEIDDNIASVVLNVYNFEGGAHGSSYFIPINYNVKTKNEIKMADLFQGQTNYLQKISDFCINDLTKQLTDSGGIEMTDASWIGRGAGPTAENFQFFLINKDNIVFYFPQYQVAAGAAGSFKVTMPLK